MYNCEEFSRHRLLLRFFSRKPNLCIGAFYTEKRSFWRTVAMVTSSGERISPRESPLVISDEFVS